MTTHAGSPAWAASTFFDDDQQFPDTQYVVFEYPGDGRARPAPSNCIFEQRIWSPYVQERVTRTATRSTAPTAGCC